ncbi:hypothetical protein [Arthrobacter cryoconiti]|uniref:Uncharacterized protein n=1 Tax=Arthrobacter cryoconiti TaxID=748907 RepID=A0ABV8R2I3_9MICC|nr:hypothetical protein [Arthrobacter cryoconiti]MCC9068646.1 hypothetical protein [Arthrobacter cryoconiti]
MRIKQLVISLTVLICAFAGYNFGKYLGSFTGLLFTAILGCVGVVIISGWAAKDEKRES